MSSEFNAEIRAKFESNYEHDEKLGHKFIALTGMTDKCVLCGCMVNDCQNWPGKNGAKFDKPCPAAKNRGQGS